MSRFPFYGDEPIAGHWQIRLWLLPQQHRPSWWRRTLMWFAGWYWLDLDRS